MKLSTQTQQGQLLYFNPSSESLLVSENAYFRWLNFADVTQSIMHKRCPWQLTLPHQTALLLPLLHFQLRSVTELGLGGGNLARFILNLKPDTDFTSIEYNQAIIECFRQYFNPDNIDLKLVNVSAEDWLSTDKNPIPWLIYDIYQGVDPDKVSTLIKVLKMSNGIAENLCISINVPQSTRCELELLFKNLSIFSPHYQMVYFNVPRYQNIIIHLISADIDIHDPKLTNINNLPEHLFRRWCRYWLLAKKVPSTK